MLKRFFLFMIFAVLTMTACKETPNQTSETEEVKPENTEKMQADHTGEELDYKSGDTTLKGYLAYDKNAGDELRPGILVLHEWWGHNQYSRDRANMLADLGYVALAVDMYGEGKLAEHPEDAGKFAGMVMSNLDEAKLRFEASLKALKESGKVDTSKIAAVGYCFGGSVALCMANAGYELDAVAAFHSSVDLPIPPSEKTKAMILVANGADDPMISAESVENFKLSMDENGVSYRYMSYPGAVHAFTSPYADKMGKKFDLPLAYNEEADKKSWNLLKQLLSNSFSI